MSLDSTTMDSYIHLFYSSLDCARALTCLILYENKEHDQLAALGFNPLDYNELNTARDSLAATKFLSKAKFLDCSYDLKKVAIEKFLDAEAECKLANDRINRGSFLSPFTESAISIAKRVISNVLGSFSPDEFVNSCNWGPGATTSIRRQKATAPLKFESENRISREAYDFVIPWFRTAYPLWDIKFLIDGNSKIVTVPKDAKSDRTIAIEPGINLWFQKGIGSMIRRRLGSIGIDLNDQRHNQEKARIGSLYSNVATIDFASASDTISKVLIRELFSDKWLSLLETFRSRHGLLDGKQIIYEKFSSMGNGFTFELETLVFYSLAIASCDILKIDASDVSVYGDDVIIPCAAAELFIQICSDVGFTTNKKKSFSSTYYRESCGEHFWNGERIKPIFQKENFNGKTQIIKSANNVRRLAHRFGFPNKCARLQACWQLLESRLGDSCPRYSEGFGDLALIVNIDESFNHKPAKHGYEGYRVKIWAPVAVQQQLDHEGLRLQKLKAAQSFRDFSFTDITEAGCYGNFVPLPGRIKHAKVNMLIHRWYDDGKWL